MDKLHPCSSRFVLIFLHHLKSRFFRFLLESVTLLLIHGAFELKNPFPGVREFVLDQIQIMCFQNTCGTYTTT